MAGVDFEHVDKVYPDGTRAVIDCDLQVDDGELLVVVGPSGCGKSTVLRLLAGLEQATRGTLRIGGRVVNDLSPQERNVAMVFQDYALYPHMSVRRNLEFPLRMRGLAPAEMRRQVDRVAELLEIGHLGERLPRQLSGGQRQRVAMGRALVREPTVFLLDEPLSNLDARLRAQVRVEIGDLQRRTHTTMLYVTHDQVEAMTLGQRVAVLHQGRVQQVAAPRDLYEQPANVFVAGFIGSPPMNLFPTRMELEDGGGVFVTLGAHRLPVASGRAAAARGQRSAAGQLTAGVRPEAIELAAEGGGQGTIAATVEHAECLGHEALAQLSVGDTRLVARLPAGAEIRRGDRVHVRVDPGRVHLFGDDGARLEA